MNHSFRKLRGLLLIALTMMLTAATAQVRYTTIAPGNWGDFGVWSVDGETACYCAPPAEVEDITIQIQHRISSISDITIGSDGKIVIDITGALEMPGATLNVEEGSLIAEGMLHTQQLDVCDAGHAVIGNSGRIGTRLEVNGSLDLVFSSSDTFWVNSASVHVNYGGELDLQNVTLFLNEGDFVNDSRVELNNSSVYTAIGDIKNRGTIAFANACITSMEGDLYNTGMLLGEGAIDVAGTLVSDRGELGGINWCASEWYTNLTDKPNCAVAAVICGNIGTSEPAAFRRIELLTKMAPEGIELHWAIDGEKGVQLYEIQKATSNYMFFPIAWMDPSTDKYYHKQYSCIDNTPSYDVVYYRIAVWDSSGQTTYSNVVQVGHQPVTPPSI